MTDKKISAKKKQTAVSAARVSKLEKSISETNKKIDLLTDTIGDVVSMVQSSANAANNPIIKNKYLESEEQSLGAEGHVEFDDHNPSMEVDRPDEIETEVFSRDKLKDLSFNEEKIEVYIQTTSETDAAQVFEIEVNGQKEFFRRGENKVVARKFVEGMARAKPITYDNEEYLGDDGSKHVRYPTRKGLRYGFSLVNPKPIDNAWIQSILAQP